MLSLKNYDKYLFMCFLLPAVGKTMAENLAELPALKEGQQVIMPIDQPIKSSGHIQVRAW